MSRRQEFPPTKDQGVKLGVSYHRVSTDEQAFEIDGSRKKDGSIQVQQHRCIVHVEELSKNSGDLMEISEHLIDEGYSGKNTKRPSYQKMVALIKARRIDFIVASELSRLSRSVIDFLDLVALCSKYDVDMFVIGNKFDTTEPQGKFFMTMSIAMAQFEREITAMRVKENVYARLIKDGKINGSAEILGLDRDPARRGHFVRNEEELKVVEKVFRLYIKVPSRKKLFEEIERLALSGKRGKKITPHVLDVMLDNAQWRYRGKWRANEDSKHLDQNKLPLSRQYREVQLPHGPLLDEKLLDEVVEKSKMMRDKRRKSGSSDYIYLLSQVLKFEDGSSFYGQSGKGGLYRYYHNETHDIRIRAEEVDDVVVARLKQYFLEHESFEVLVKQAIRNAQDQLPKIEQEIDSLKKQIRSIEEEDDLLRQQLLSRLKSGDQDSMKWLDLQVAQLSSKKDGLKFQLSSLSRKREDIFQKSGLADLAATVREFSDRFDGLTKTEQRSYVEKIVKQVVVKANNSLELHLFVDPTLIVERKKSSGTEGNGVASGD